MKVIGRRSTISSKLLSNSSGQRALKRKHRGQEIALCLWQDPPQYTREPTDPLCSAMRTGHKVLNNSGKAPGTEEGIGQERCHHSSAWVETPMGLEDSNLQRLNQNQAESHPDPHSSPASVEAEATTRAGHGRKKTWSGNAWNWVWPELWEKLSLIFLIWKHGLITSPYSHNWGWKKTMAHNRAGPLQTSGGDWEVKARCDLTERSHPQWRPAWQRSPSQDPTHRAGVSPRVTRHWGSSLGRKPNNQETKIWPLTLKEIKTKTIVYLAKL